MLAYDISQLKWVHIDMLELSHVLINNGQKIIIPNAFHIWDLLITALPSLRSQSAGCSFAFHLSFEENLPNTKSLSTGVFSELSFESGVEVQPYNMDETSM